MTTLTYIRPSICLSRRAPYNSITKFKFSPLAVLHELSLNPGLHAQNELRQKNVFAPLQPTLQALITLTWELTMATDSVKMITFFSISNKILKLEFQPHKFKRKI